MKALNQFGQNQFKNWLIIIDFTLQLTRLFNFDLILMQGPILFDYSFSEY